MNLSLDYNADQFDSGWPVHNGEQLQGEQNFSADVIIIGSGAGGGISAEILSNAGINVLIVEEGPLRTAKDFRMREDEAYADLYQEAAARKTKDKAINILQGRSVGGSTTVNWTSSFRTPAATLDYWQQHFASEHCDSDTLKPWFEQVEQRLAISPWPVDPNENNRVLRDGAAALGWSYGVIARNVKGCANLGYCGMGCPMNAKQSMLTTTIPTALANGASLLNRVRVTRLIHDGKTVLAAEARAINQHGQVKPDTRIHLTAKHFILAGGAINTPALLLRSQVPDPFHRIGQRTFLHPVAISVAKMPQEVRADAGAPQSIYSDQFTFADGVAGRLGYKLEVPPIHPLIASTILLRHGQPHAAFMRELKYINATLALMRDGFHPESTGGTVALDRYGDAVLDYPLNSYLWDGIRRSLLSMTELQFAAGANEVLPLHLDALPAKNVAEAKAMIQRLPMQALRMQLFSAHVMGGCAFGEDRTKTVCDSAGRLRYLDNVSVHDGSLFPTSLGVNPQLTIYALIAKLSSALIARL
ncbi:GMC family oxidoreductase [Permianibacter aggregans]|uniref:Choline dehydrogenase-like flavoprotein n=1 Tax=Permianibacter aggregans TaxID=1510150 RepID=A0A4R6V096_9GAMM|nr:GMC family oxidoreductase [Permianibacter aggregans]QGX40446.1 GMC family oxidoreductase [Permianibacter aggregans]TDQ49414.1 choline dehydrogenase-like flavoprotein [Permianibacter aggregans]